MTLQYRSPGAVRARFAPMDDPAARIALADLLDRAAIFELTVDYCTALDSGDWDALRAVFTAEATARLGGTDHDGIDEIIGRCRAALTGLDASQHMISNHRIHVGNATPVAEFNMWADPHAVDKTLRSGLPLEFVGWDVSRRHAVIEPELATELRLIGTPLAEFCIGIQGADVVDQVGQRAQSLH